MKKLQFMKSMKIDLKTMKNCSDENEEVIEKRIPKKLRARPLDSEKTNM